MKSSKLLFTIPKLLEYMCIIVLNLFYFSTLGMIEHMGSSFNKHLLSTRRVLGFVLDTVLKIPFYSDFIPIYQVQTAMSLEHYCK